MSSTIHEGTQDLFGDLLGRRRGSGREDAPVPAVPLAQVPATVPDPVAGPTGRSWPSKAEVGLMLLVLGLPALMAAAGIHLFGLTATGKEHQLVGVSEASVILSGIVYGIGLVMLAWSICLSKGFPNRDTMQTGVVLFVFGGFGGLCTSLMALLSFH